MGAKLQISIILPSESAVVLTGAVATHVPTGGMGGRGPGIDIRLESIPTSALWLIESALATANIAFTKIPSGDEPPDPGLEDQQHIQEAEVDLIAALVSELDLMRKMNSRQVLGVDDSASIEQIRLAFSQLSRKYHPDKFARYQSDDIRSAAAEIFLLLRDAYGQLSRGKSAAHKVEPAPSPAPASAASPFPSLAPPVRTPPPIPRPLTEAQKSSKRSTDRAMSVVSDLRLDPDPVEPDVPKAAPKSEPVVAAGSSPVATSLGAGMGTGLGVGTGPSASIGNKTSKLLDSGQYDTALALYRLAARKDPQDLNAKAGMELCMGLRALAQGDRLAAAEYFSAAVSLVPDHPRALPELEKLQRRATGLRKNFLNRLMKK